MSISETKPETGSVTVDISGLSASITGSHPDQLPGRFKGTVTTDGRTCTECQLFKTYDNFNKAGVYGSGPRAGQNKYVAKCKNCRYGKPMPPTPKAKLPPPSPGRKNGTTNGTHIEDDESPKSWDNFKLSEPIITPEQKSSVEVPKPITDKPKASNPESDEEIGSSDSLEDPSSEDDDDDINLLVEMTKQNQIEKPQASEPITDLSESQSEVLEEEVPKKQRRVVYYKKDEPDIIRGEFISRQQKEDAATKEEAKPIPSQSDKLRNARNLLLMRMERNPEIAKRLKITPALVMKMPLDKVDNAMATFDSHTQLNMGASFFRTISVTFANAVEGMVSMSRLRDKVLLRGYAQNVDAHPDLDNVCQDLAIQHMEEIEEYLCPESKLALIFVSTGVTTHNNNRSRIQKDSGDTPNQGPIVEEADNGYVGN